MTPLMQLAVKLNATEAQVQFALMAGRFNDYRPVLGGPVLRILRSMERRIFETEGAAFGGVQWPDLHPRTIADRLRKGFPGAHPILQQTHRLINSLVGARATQDSIVEIDPFGMTFGTSVFYGPPHQRGRPHGRPRIPKRQFVPTAIPPVVLSQIRTSVRDYLIEGRVSGHAA